jgi:PAS domain S-box-containing protein
VHQRLQTIKKGLAIDRFETVLQAKDGHGIDVSLLISPIRNSTGEVVGASAIVRDIGERLRTQRKLRKSEQLFHEVFEHVCPLRLN